MSEGQYHRKQEIFSEPKRKDKLNSLRDFKIHSNGLSPNTSVIRGKNILKDTYIEQSNPAHRKEGYNFKRTSNSYENNPVERHSYNYSENQNNNTNLRNHKRQPSEQHHRHKTPNSSNFNTGRIPKNNIDFQNNNISQNKTNMSSNAKQKIKSLLNGGNSNVFNLGNSMNYEESNLVSDKRKTAKLITTNNNENAKKLHKKSNSMKNDL